MLFRICETFVRVLPNPAETADFERFDRTYPQAADEVLGVVLVGVVDALSVEHAHLIVKPVVPFLFALDAVALELQTEVAARTLMLADAVVDRGEFHRGLRVRAKAHVERAVRVFKTE